MQLDKEQFERVQKIMSGEIESDDPTLSFIAKKARSVLAEKNTMEKTLLSAEDRVVELRRGIVQRQGAVNSYAEDIHGLLLEHDGATPEQSENKQTKDEHEEAA